MAFIAQDLWPPNISELNPVGNSTKSETNAETYAKNISPQSKQLETKWHRIQNSFH